MNQPSFELATLAGGCFWCTEAAFSPLQGVVAVTPGYIGGKTQAPTYESVCTGQTGHAEAVEIRFDPKVIDYETLLQVFFSIHDPTTLNRQGHDIGSQYRSAIFYHNDAQLQTARNLIDALDNSDIWHDPIVTEISLATHFYVAESLHHDYFARNPYQGYCMAVVAPKVAKVHKLFSEILKPPTE